VKYGYRAAPILVALVVLFVSMLGLRGVVHAQALGTLLLTATGTPATGVAAAGVSWATTDAAGVRFVGIHLRDADLQASTSTSVTITSDSDSIGFTLVLAEVTGNTTTFSSFFMLHPTISTTSPAGPFPTSTGVTASGHIIGVPALQADHNDTVTVTYTDQNTTLGVVSIPATLTVDTEGPEIDEVTPTEGTIASSVSTYSGEVTDVDSGLAAATLGNGLTVQTIAFLVNVGADNVAGATIVDPFFLALSDITDSDDAVIGKTITMSGLSLQNEVWFTIRAADLAGNVTVFDTDRLTVPVEMVSITIDSTAPVYTESFTGVGWDNIAKSLTFNNLDSIVVIFTDNLTNLDADSVTAGDFSVEGNSVTRADVFDNGPVTSTTEVDDLVGAALALDIRRAVFLTLGSDLAPDEEPEVALVGDRVDDEAGNTAVTNSEDAGDRIAPTITIGTPSPELAGSGDTVTIIITSDEALDGDDIVVLVTNAQDGTNLATTVDYDGGNSWTVTTAGVDASAAYTIYVTGVDLDTENASDAGTAAGAAFPIGTTALDDDHTVFEGDVELLAPRVTPGDSDAVDTRDPFFIIINFGETTTADLLRDEGSEYNADDFTTVTLTVLTLDGVNILGDQDTKDDIQFVIAVNDIALGDHTIVVNAMDEVGNTLAVDVSVTFTVEERAAFSLGLDPGWNLVSFPGDPADGDINVVMAGVANVTAVVAYDPALPGGFLSAIREEDGSFAGTLTTIESSRGYWINTATFETLEVDIPALAAGQVGLLPPSLPISVGWNLVPVLDVVGAGAAGDVILANTYFGSLGDIAAVYTYDTITNTWQFVDSGTNSTDNVVLGKAYWVFTTSAGVLVPSGVPQ